LYLNPLNISIWVTIHERRRRPFKFIQAIKAAQIVLGAIAIVLSIAIIADPALV